MYVWVYNDKKYCIGKCKSPITLHMFHMLIVCDIWCKSNLERNKLKLPCVISQRLSCFLSCRHPGLGRQHKSSWQQPKLILYSSGRTIVQDVPVSLQFSWSVPLWRPLPVSAVRAYAGGVQGLCLLMSPSMRGQGTPPYLTVPITPVSHSYEEAYSGLNRPLQEAHRSDLQVVVWARLCSRQAVHIHYGE